VRLASPGWQHEQGVPDGAFAGRVRRVRNQLTAKGHRGRATAVEIDRVDQTE